MKKLISLSLLLIAFSSCDKDDDKNDSKNDCQPETVITKWTAEKQVILEFDTEFKRNNYTIKDGNNLVFEYIHTRAQCDYIADDEWGETLIFQVEDQNSNFEFTNDEILVTNCFYQQQGAWVNHKQYQIKSGAIKGEKISGNQWKITADIETVPQVTEEKPIKIKFTEIFTK